MKLEDIEDPAAWVLWLIYVVAFLVAACVAVREGYYEHKKKKQEMKQ